MPTFWPETFWEPTFWPEFFWSGSEPVTPQPDERTEVRSVDEISASESHTVEEDTNFVAIYVGHRALDSSNQVVSITFGGIAATLVTRVLEGSNNVVHAELWHLKESDIADATSDFTSRTQDMTITFNDTGPSHSSISVVQNYKGVNQNQPFREIGTSQGNTNGVVSVSCPSQNGDLVVGHFIARDDGPTFSGDLPDQEEMWHEQSNIMVSEEVITNVGLLTNHGSLFLSMATDSVFNAEDNEGNDPLSDFPVTNNAENTLLYTSIDSSEPIQYAMISAAYISASEDVPVVDPNLFFVNRRRRALMG